MACYGYEMVFTIVRLDSTDRFVSSLLEHQIELKYAYSELKRI